MMEYEGRTAEDLERSGDARTGSGMYEFVANPNNVDSRMDSICRTNPHATEAVGRISARFSQLLSAGDNPTATSRDTHEELNGLIVDLHLDAPLFIASTDQDN